MAYFKVQGLWFDNIIIDDPDINAVLFTNFGKILEQLPKLWTTDTIRAINRHMSFDLSTIHGLLERSRHLLIVSFLIRLTKWTGCVPGVEATDHMVQLRGGEDTIIGVLDLERIERCLQRLDQMRSRSSRITGENNPGLPVMDLSHRIDEQLIRQLLVGRSKVTVLRISQSGRMSLPFLLAGVSQERKKQFCKERTDLQHVSLDSDESVDCFKRRFSSPAHHWINHLDTIVFSWIVTRGDHDPDPCLIASFGSQGRQDTNRVYHMVEPGIPARHTL